MSCTYDYDNHVTVCVPFYVDVYHFLIGLAQFLGCISLYLVVGLIVNFAIITYCKRVLKEDEYDTDYFMFTMMMWPFLVTLGPIFLACRFAYKWIEKKTGVEFS